MLSCIKLYSWNEMEYSACFQLNRLIGKCMFVRIDYWSFHLLCVNTGFTDKSVVQCVMVDPTLWYDDSACCVICIICIFFQNQANILEPIIEQSLSSIICSTNMHHLVKQAFSKIIDYLRWKTMSRNVYNQLIVCNN